jgi:hypothetical protein
MKIFVEGTENTMKTPIAKRLAEKFGATYWKVPTEKSNWVKKGAFAKSLGFDVLLPELYSQMGNAGIVSDRCYVSEYVYSEFFARDTDWGLIRQIHDRWNELGAIHVHCTRRDWRDTREDDLVDRDDFQSIDQGYRYFYTMRPASKLARVHVDDFGDNFDLMVDCVIQAVARLSRFKSYRFEEVSERPVVYLED